MWIGTTPHTAYEDKEFRSNIAIKRTTLVLHVWEMVDLIKILEMVKAL
jgi:hypothetical protein